MGKTQSVKNVEFIEKTKITINHPLMCVETDDIFHY